MTTYPSNTVAAIDQTAWFNANSFEDVQTLCEDLFLVCRIDFPEDMIAYLYDPEGCVADNDPYGLYDDEEDNSYYEVSDLPPLPYLHQECFTCGKSFEDCDCIFF